MSEKFDRAWKLLEDPKRWTQGFLGRTAAGDPIETTRGLRTKATCFCILGALSVVYGRMNTAEPRLKILSRLKDYPAPWSARISEFNDNAEHKEVVELLKRADV